MPKNTKIHRCVDDVKAKDKKGVNPYAVCQASTGQSFASGKKKRKDGKAIDSPKESFEQKIHRILHEGLDPEEEIRLIIGDLRHVNNILSNPQIIHDFSTIGNKIHKLNKITGGKVARECSELSRAWNNLAHAIADVGNDHRAKKEPDQRKQRIASQYFTEFQRILDGLINKLF